MLKRSRRGRVAKKLVRSAIRKRKERSWLNACGLNLNTFARTQGPSLIGAHRSGLIVWGSPVPSYVDAPMFDGAVQSTTLKEIQNQVNVTAQTYEPDPIRKLMETWLSYLKPHKPKPLLIRDLDEESPIYQAMRHRPDLDTLAITDIQLKQTGNAPVYELNISFEDIHDA